MAAAGKNVIAFGSGLSWPRCSFRSRSASPTCSSASSTTTRTARAARCSTSPATSPCPGRARKSCRRSSSASRRRCARRALLALPVRGAGPRSRRGRSGGGPRAARTGCACAARPSARTPPAALLRFHALGYRAFFAMRCGGELVGRARRGLQGRARAAVLRGRGAADGGPRPGEPRLRERAALRGARRAPPGDPHAPGVPGERHPLVLLGHRRPRLRRARCSRPTRPSRSSSASSEDGAARPDAVARCCRAFASATPPENGDEWRFETSFATPDGEERDLQLSVSAFRGSPDRRVVVVEDMTDRHPRGAGPGRARAAGLARRARGRRRPRGQHADRGTLLLRPAAALGDLARAIRAIRS